MNENERNPIEARIDDVKREAYDKIDELFGDGAAENGFDTVPDGNIIALLKGTVDLMAYSTLWSLSAKIDAKTTARLSLSANGIKVERRETKGAAL